MKQAPFDYLKFQKKYGTIIDMEQECPGVYYVACRGKDSHSCATELYVVKADSPIISEKAKAYGEALPGDVLTLVYPYDLYKGQGWHIIEYEIHKYLADSGQPLPDGHSLLADEIFGKEIAPKYFGDFPVPADTPWGKSLEHRTIWNGIFRLRTEEAGWVLAICYPLSQDLYEPTLELAELLPYDREHGIDNTYGYRFYAEHLTCLPVFELLQGEPQLRGRGINQGALYNVILRDFPEYADQYNAQQARYSSARAARRMIVPAPDAGTEIFFDYDNIIHLDDLQA